MVAELEQDGRGLDKGFSKYFNPYFSLNLTSDKLSEYFGDRGNLGKDSGIEEELKDFNDLFFNKPKVSASNWKESGAYEALNHFGKKVFTEFGLMNSPKSSGREKLKIGLTHTLKGFDKIYSFEGDYSKLSEEQAKKLSDFFGDISDLAYNGSQKDLKTADRSDYIKESKKRSVSSDREIKSRKDKQTSKKGVEVKGEKSKKKGKEEKGWKWWIFRFW